MGLATLTKLYLVREEAFKAQLAGCEDARAAADCASGFLGALREEFSAACEDAALRRRAADLVAACQSAAGLIAGMTHADVSLRLAAPAVRPPRVERALGGLRRFGPAAACAALCAYLLLRGEIPAAILALIAAAACALMPAVRAPRQPLPEARAVPRPDPAEMVLRLRRLIRDLDALLDASEPPEAEAPRLSAPLMESIQMLCEASLTGDSAYALRAASPLVAALEAQGLQLILYGPETAGWFDLMPGAGERRTIRPALVAQGRLLARGQAVEPMR